MAETKDTNPKDAVGVRKWRQFCAVPLTVLAEVGVALLEGARKYGRHNYRVAGVRASVYVDAAFGHIVQWWEGEDIDSDSGLSHVTKAIASLVVLRDAMIQGKLNDDRPPVAKLDDVRDDLQRAVDRIFENWPESVPPYMQRHGSNRTGRGPDAFDAHVRETLSRKADFLIPVTAEHDLARLEWLAALKQWKPVQADPSSPLVFADYADLEKRIMGQIADVTGIANFPPDVTSRSLVPLLEGMAEDGWTFYFEPVSGTIRATRPETDERPEQSFEAAPMDLYKAVPTAPQSFPTDGHDGTPVEFATRRTVAMPPAHVAEYSGVTSAEQVERASVRDLTQCREPYRPVEDLGDGRWADVDPESLAKAATSLGQAAAVVYGLSDPEPEALQAVANQITPADLAFVRDDPPPPAPPAFDLVKDAYCDFLLAIDTAKVQHPEYLTSRAQYETLRKAVGAAHQCHGKPRTHSTRDQQKYHWQFALGTLSRSPGFSEKSASAIGELWPVFMKDRLASLEKVL